MDHSDHHLPSGSGFDFVDKRLYYILYITRKKNNNKHGQSTVNIRKYNILSSSHSTYMCYYVVVHCVHAIVDIE